MCGVLWPYGQIVGCSVATPALTTLQQSVNNFHYTREEHVGEGIRALVGAAHPRLNGVGLLQSSPRAGLGPGVPCLYLLER